MAEYLFAWPWLFLLLPLPWLAWRFLPKAESQLSGSVRVPFYHWLGEGTESSGSSGWLSRLMAIIVWLLVLTAAARPQWVDEPLTFPLSGRDLLMAMDVSGSMDTRDMQLNGHMVSRLTMVKEVMSAFIQRRQGDRVGLVLFGSRAYLQTPLTFDTQTTARLMQESEIGLAGRETAIGDAIGLSIKRLRDNTEAERILVLLTDGANTAGTVDPLQAAEYAAKEGLTIYAIGVGADEMLVRDLFGSRLVNPATDLDEKTMQAIAAKTGGRYFRARDTSDLEKIYQIIDELEPVSSDVVVIRPITEWFWLPLMLALIICLLCALMNLLKQAGWLYRDIKTEGLG
ncbi:MAG: VWA domain-containing protein [Xanthomonadales bacterium]|nr:VWA domain-containing protein [Xanthomonadales bacterium]